MNKNQINETRDAARAVLNITSELCSQMHRLSPQIQKLQQNFREVEPCSRLEKAMLDVIRRPHGASLLADLGFAADRLVTESNAALIEAERINADIPAHSEAVTA